MTTFISSITAILTAAMQPAKIIGAASGAAGQLIAIRVYAYVGFSTGSDMFDLMLTNIGGQLIFGNVIELLASSAGIA